MGTGGAVLMAFGYAVICDEGGVQNPHGTMIYELYQWQSDADQGVIAHRRFTRNPIDGILPPDYQSHHNQMIALKEDDFNEEIDEEGYSTGWLSSGDSVNTIHDSLDAMVRNEYKEGDVSMLFMEVMGLGAWAKEWDEGKSARVARQQEIQEFRRYAEIRPQVSPASRQIVTAEMLQGRNARLNEELLYNNYIQRRREERARRDGEL
jgi:hypothetical protein